MFLFADLIGFPGAGGLGRGEQPPDLHHGTKCDLITGVQLHFQCAGDLKTNLLVAGGLGR